MPALQFDRDSMAAWYARQHLQTDPGIVSVHYLPANSGEREIRFIEVNQLIGDRTDEILDPIEFGVDAGMESSHKLLVLDVTPDQWSRIRKQALPLPDGWELDGEILYE